MGKYLKLSFRDAKFFKVDNNTKDFVFDINGQTKRKEFFRDKKQNVSISVHQVSNMLHVLLGERPSATYRETLIKRIEPIFDMASKSLIKIDTPMFTNKKGVKEYPSEIIRTKKAVYNSYNPLSNVYYWERVKSRLIKDGNDEVFIKFTSVLSEILGYNVLEKPLKYVIEDTKKIDKNNLQFKSLELEITGNTALFNILKGEKGSLNSYPESLLTINTGIEKAIRLNGSIIVPVEEWAIEKIRNGKGIARILDGGFVYIESLEDGGLIGEEFFEEYININELEEYETKN